MSDLDNMVIAVVPGMEWLNSEIKTGKRAHQTWLESFHGQYQKGNPDECWLWTGKKGSNGYGMFVGPGVKYHLAHKVSWALHSGRIPEQGEVIRHKCNTPACVNPLHLTIGSNTENMKDMLRCGRSVAVMDYFRAEDIRDLYATGEWTQAQLAEKYGVSQQLISLIVRSEKWAIKTFDDYQAAAVMTLQPGADLLYTCSKMMIEAAELAQHIYKHVYHGAPLDTDKLLDEMGDVLYYIAVTAHLMGWNLGTIAELNIEKLRQRHGERYNAAHYTNGA